MKKRTLLIFITAIALIGTNVKAEDKTYVWNSQGGEKDEAMLLKGDPAHGRDVYEVCAACHQPEGWGLTDGTFPQIAGQHPHVLVKQLADIRAKNRDNPTMYPFALPTEIGGPQSIADVVAYIKVLKMNPHNGVGPGRLVEKGKQLYKENCERCHGPDGMGNNDKFYPRIQAQHYTYLVRQFKWIKEGKRRNANPDMVKQVQNFSEDDIEAVLDYTSRLKPPPEMIAPEGWKNPDFILKKK